jgi:membrane associated rhomboid family serine protease
VAPFTYTNTGYAIVALATIAVYGWLLERRHGPILVLALFAIAAIGGAAVTATDSTLPLALGANGGALALLIAWALPDVLSLRAGREIEGDLLGTAVVAVVVALMPLVSPGASWVSDGVGALAGLVIGLPLALTSDG